jgi:futalosine hydrolase
MRKTLILVPTDLERQGLGNHLRNLGQVALCGFGPIAAAARTAGLIAELHPDRVLLLGLAGRLSGSLTIGHAYRFSAVACYGIGSGSGEAFLSASGMGWSQWAEDPASAEEAVGDLIPLAEPSRDGRAGVLLTACAASADAQDVALRRSLFPSAVAEDMEGFGVAFACRLAGVPLDIVRGISNDAGDRDKARWQIADALAAAAKLAKTVVENAP